MQKSKDDRIQLSDHPTGQRFRTLFGKDIDWHTSGFEGWLRAKIRKRLSIFSKLIDIRSLGSISLQHRRLFQQLSFFKSLDAELGRVYPI